MNPGVEATVGGELGAGIGVAVIVIVGSSVSVTLGSVLANGAGARLSAHPVMRTVTNIMQVTCNPNAGPVVANFILTTTSASLSPTSLRFILAHRPTSATLSITANY